MVEFSFITGSGDETIQAGRNLAPLLEEGDVLGLVGELGSGKTWFTKGVALGLGVAPDTAVTSPSFTLVNDYPARVTLYHMDLYRLEARAEFFSAGLEEYFCGRGITAVEWADRWPELLPAETLEVRFVVLDEQRREITLSGSHPRAVGIIERFRKGDFTTRFARGTEVTEGICS
ncbi:MAG: tRNA (adenosine(37)-N6)-threonylcarbamoyltransferase complex ATPase subunit type 1 TsaE [Thermodesulfobacteriota bacterium]